MPSVLKQPLIGLNWILLKTLHMAGKRLETENSMMKYGKKMAMTANAFKFKHKHSKVCKTTKSWSS